MGYVVECNDVCVWEPRLKVGDYFVANIEALEKLVGGKSGIVSPMVEDIEIDYTRLKPFIDKVLGLFEDSSNTPLHAMISGITEVLLALEAKITGDDDLRKGTERTASLIERSRFIFYDLEVYRKQGKNKA